MIYLNEYDAYPASWLRNLYPDAVVDETSITLLNRRDYGPFPEGVPRLVDFRQYRQCHFFAGIGGWLEALRIAGWPDEVPIWTGSCPCQPFSTAGSQGGFNDPRHLWPHFRRHIQAGHPPIVVGEQVSTGPDVAAWLTRVFDDLEDDGYLPWAVDLPAAGVGAPIIRQRFFWGAVRGDCVRISRESGDGRREFTTKRLSGPASCGLGGGAGASGEDGAKAVDCGQLVRSRCDGRRAGGNDHASDVGSVVDSAGSDLGQSNGARPSEQCDLRRGPREADRANTEGRSLGIADQPRQYQRELHQRELHQRVSRATGFADQGEAAELSGDTGGSGHQQSAIGHQPDNFWSTYLLLHFTDGKTRRIEPGLEPLAHGLPAGNRWAIPRLRELGIDADTAKRIVALARANRVGRLRGYGNAIGPQVAARFLRVWMDVLGISESLIEPR